MTKTVFATIAGKTNAGKSSLLNAIIGEKIASVSNKPQTTRTRIIGIHTVGETQLVFFDTPGLHKGKTKLSQHMMDITNESVKGSDVDVIIFMIDCTKQIDEQEKAMLKSFSDTKTPVVLLLNKIDLLKNKEVLARQMNELSTEFDLKTIIPVSVTQNDGVDIVIEEIMKLSSESPLFFPTDMITDQPEKIIASEIIREKMLNLLDAEVPHGIAVVVEEMSERDDENKEILDISAVIYCERDSHKGIVIGSHGVMLKKIGTLAREELEEFFRIKVNLKCWVKVKKDWRNKEVIIRNLGLSGK